MDDVEDEKREEKRQLLLDETVMDEMFESRRVKDPDVEERKKRLAFTRPIPLIGQFENVMSSDVEREKEQNTPMKERDPKSITK
jgi:hypothetical protein